MLLQNTPVIFHTDLADLIVGCHAAAKRNGWWKDPETGNDIIRNFGEMISLSHSEVAEAWVACLSGEMCNKPSLEGIPGEAEELADMVIRNCDLAGGHGINMSLAYTSKVELLERIEIIDVIGGPSDDVNFVYSALNGCLSRALEGWRTSANDPDLELPVVAVALADALLIAHTRCKTIGWDLMDVIDRKRRYNDIRADHKIESRQKPGGKKI